MIQTPNIHKLDEKSDERQSEPPKEDNEVKDSKGSDNITKTNQNVVLKLQVEDIETFDEFMSDSSTKKSIDTLIKVRF